ARYDLLAVLHRQVSAAKGAGARNQELGTRTERSGARLPSSLCSPYALRPAPCALAPRLTLPIGWAIMAALAIHAASLPATGPGVAPAVKSATTARSVSRWHCAPPSSIERASRTAA